jgi:hypothetical protein
VNMHVTKLLTPTYEDRLRVTMISGTMLRVHTTYPLCGWVRSGASKYGTKLVGVSSIGAGGGGTDLTSPKTQGGFTVPGRPLAEGCAQDPGKPDGTEATSFCFSRPTSRRPVGCSPASSYSSGSRCTIPVG